MYYAFDVWKDGRGQFQFHTFSSIARLCHIGHGFLKFSLIYLNSERKVCGNVL